MNDTPTTAQESTTFQEMWDVEGIIGQRLVEHLNRTGWSLGTFASIAGISKGYAHQLVSGRAVPSILITLQVAAAFECTIDDLLGPDVIATVRHAVKERRRTRAEAALRAAGVRPEDL